MKKELIALIAVVFFAGTAFGGVEDYPPELFRESMENILETNSYYAETEEIASINWMALGFSSEAEFQMALAENPNRFDYLKYETSPRVYSLVEEMKPVYREFYYAFNASDLEDTENSYSQLMEQFDEFDSLLHPKINLYGLRIQFAKMINVVRNKHLSNGTTNGGTVGTEKTVTVTRLDPNTGLPIDPNKTPEPGTTGTQATGGGTIMLILIIALVLFAALFAVLRFVKR